MANYYIKDNQGNVINTISATESYVERKFPGMWELVPEVVRPPARKTVLTHREFLKRLTAQEFKTIRQAAKSNAEVDMFMYLFELSSEVNLDDADTIAGVRALELAGILNAGRSTEILA